LPVATEVAGGAVPAAIAGRGRAQGTGQVRIIYHRRMSKQRIQTNAAPDAIGTYSQAVRAGDTVYLSGQIPLDPATMQVVDGPIEAQIERVCRNLEAVATAAGGTMDDIVKVTVFLTDLGDFAKVNEVMARFFSEPYPARAAVEVAGLPKGVPVEMDAVMVLTGD
jgi:reactive intermediate/imine deaminase